MNLTTDPGFRFGLEAEFLLVDAGTFRPLWYRDLNFRDLHDVLAAVRLDDVPSFDGLELEPPHRKLMPYAVEGYHIPDPDFHPIDLLPKGIEIRTPVSCSIEDCLASFVTLHGRMQEALATMGCLAVALSHHPTETRFEGPQNKRRYDYWQWAMEVMTTYGPDVNISLPPETRNRIDFSDLHAKVNYYGPALAALSLGSPFREGKPWRIRGRIGKSLRTYRRSVIAPAIELHPEENGRMEFKLFEMSPSVADYAAYFLLWLALLLDDGLRGRASHQSRVYDLGCIARDGLATEAVASRAGEVLERAPEMLASQGFDPHPLNEFRVRLTTNRVPADWLIELFEREGTMEGVLRHLTSLRDDAGRPASVLQERMIPLGRTPGRP